MKKKLIKKLIVNVTSEFLTVSSLQKRFKYNRALMKSCNGQFC